MSITAYHLALDHPESPQNYAAETVRENINEYIIPNTEYQHFTIQTDNAAALQSEIGEEYLTDAFNQTRDVLGPAIQTLTDELCRTEIDSPSTDHDWQSLVDADGVVEATSRIGQLRGDSTFLYGIRFSHGIHTRSNLADHLNLYGPSKTDESKLDDETRGEYVVIVPFDLFTK